MKRLVSFLVAALILCSLSFSFGETAPGSPEDFLERGIKFLNEGKYTEAVHELSSAIDLKPELDDAYLNRGIAYIRLKELDKAINDFSILLGRNPNNFRACFWRGTARFANKQYKMALLDVERSLDENPNYALRELCLQSIRQLVFSGSM